MTGIEWSVFTKPWRSESASQLADKVAEMGFDGAELPVRPGFQIDPAEVPRALPVFVREFASRGLKVFSVAGTPDESLFSSCADNEVSLIRIMIPISDRGYLATGEMALAQLDKLSALAAKHGVRVGVQPHYDFYISDSSELSHLLEKYDPALIGAIWDVAHDALARKAPEHGLELLWDRLAMVNFKNAVYRESEPRNGEKVWEPYFIDGPLGMGRWSGAVKYLAENGYRGTACLTAEYTDESDLERRVATDLKYARAFLENGEEQ